MLVCFCFCFFVLFSVPPFRGCVWARSYQHCTYFGMEVRSLHRGTAGFTPTLISFVHSRYMYLFYPCLMMCVLHSVTVLRPIRSVHSICQQNSDGKSWVPSCWVTLTQELLVKGGRVVVLTAIICACDQGLHDVIGVKCIDATKATSVACLRFIDESFFIKNFA